MKKTGYFFGPAAAFIVLAASVMPVAAQSDNQPLGDYARTVRKTKDGSSSNAYPKVYDNDNLPDGTVSVVGNAGPEASSGAKNEAQDAEQSKDSSVKSEDKTADKGDKSGDKSEAKSTGPQIQPGQSAEQRQKALDASKAKLDDQKEKIAAISHELDLLQREYRLKSAEFYANTANRVQHPYGFADDDAKYKQQIADKQKELDDAKAKLDDMQETTRKSGAPNSVTE
jgi:hypothetical protein